MIGTTRSRVSFFMNRFRKMGLIEYNGRIKVNRTLLNVVLHDQLSKENSERPVVASGSAEKVKFRKRTSPEKRSAG
jgi:hypothetical protein